MSQHIWGCMSQPSSNINSKSHFLKILTPPPSNPNRETTQFETRILKARSELWERKTEGPGHRTSSRSWIIIQTRSQVWHVGFWASVRDLVSMCVSLPISKSAAQKLKPLCGVRETPNEITRARHATHAGPFSHAGCIVQWQALRRHQLWVIRTSNIVPVTGLWHCREHFSEACGGGHVSAGRPKATFCRARDHGLKNCA